MTGAPLTSLDTIHGFITAGHAIFTLVMKADGSRRTFRVRMPPESKTPGCFFVDMLTGPENTTDYRYVAYLFTGNDGALHLKPFKGINTPTTDTLKWLLNEINNRKAQLVAVNFNRHVEFWHVGSCGRCGRPLTDPESITRGLGPKCASM